MFHTHLSTLAHMCVPVDADAEHPVLAGGLGEKGAEQVVILDNMSAKKTRNHERESRSKSLFLTLPEWTRNELHLVHLEPVAVEQGLGRAVAAPQPGLFGQGELQLYRRAARHPRPKEYE